MGSRAPLSASLSAPLLLPPLSPAVDSCFTTSTSDHLLTQALTRELSSTSASSSSSSGPASLEPSSARKASAQSKAHSNGFLLPQAQQSDLSRLGSPLSSDSVSKEYQPGSPFNTSRMSTVGMSRRAAIAEESCITRHYQTPQGGYNKAGSPLQASSIALSSQAAVGTVASKVSKRRSRTNKKVPIAVLSADTSNFRAMVQQLTGIPTPQALPHIWGATAVPFFKPQPARGPVDLPTLDTSSSFLSPKLNSFLQAGHEADMSGLIPSDLASLQGKSKPYLGNMNSYEALLSSPSAAALASPWAWLATATLHGNLKQPSAAANMGKEGDQSAAAWPSSTSLESFLMVDDDQYPKVSYNTVDSWLAFDGGSSSSAIANHSPKLDFTKIAS